MTFRRMPQRCRTRRAGRPPAAPAPAPAPAPQRDEQIVAAEQRIEEARTRLSSLRDQVEKNLQEDGVLADLKVKELLERRYERLNSYGRFTDTKAGK